MEVCRQGEFGYVETGEDACELVKRFLQRALEHRPRLVILFGSSVERRWSPWSDLDVIVVFDRVDNKLETIVKLKGDVPYVELRVYTVEELIDRIRLCDIGVLDALDRGRVLHDDGLFGQIKLVFERYRELYGLRRVEDGWVAERWWNLPWNASQRVGSRTDSSSSGSEVAPHPHGNS